MIKEVIAAIVEKQLEPTTVNKEVIDEYFVRVTRIEPKCCDNWKGSYAKKINNYRTLVKKNHNY